MLRVNDIAYIYMVNLKDSINSIGFKRNRIGRIKGIEPLEVNNSQEGIYTIITEDGKEWRIATNNKTFKVVSAAELIDTINVCRVDKKNKEEWINFINNFNNILP